MTATTPTTKPLNVPVPPMFEKAIGYTGRARWVAFYWSREGQTVVWEDGVEICIGAFTTAWHIFTHHRLVSHYTSAFNFGNPYCEARYWLVLDREQRRFHAMPVQQARTMLVAQHGQRQDLLFGADSLDDLLDNLERAYERQRDHGLPDQPERDAQCRVHTEVMMRWLEGRARPSGHLRLVHNRR